MKLLVRKYYPLQHDNKRYYLENGRYSWDEILDLILSFEKHVDLQINQWQLSSIPDYFESRLGDNDGQDDDYGYEEEDGRSIHLKVYGDDFYRIHWDAKDPNSNPLGHLVHDSPKWLVAAGAAVLGYLLYKKSKDNQEGYA